MKNVRLGIIAALVAAALYAVNAPFSKLLLTYMPPTLMAGFLYLGAGLGMCFIACIRAIKKTTKKEERLTKKELPFTLAMIVLDVAAPVFLLIGLTFTTASSAALLNNFEIVATAIIALAIFKEKISARLWMGILCIMIACFVLSMENFSSFKFSYGALFVLLAAICWGLENNCTKKISSKDPLQIVLLKGIFSGAGALLIGFCTGERVGELWSIFAVLGVGLIAYGLSIFFYVHAQRLLGAARTSAYYAIAPFIGTFLSLLVFQEVPPATYWIALIIMLIGAWFCAYDEPIMKTKKNKKQD